MVTFVYLAAGLSRRFGGKFKGTVNVGEKGETLLEISMKQAIAAGADRFIFVVSEATKKYLWEEFGNEFEGMPISYTFQRTPEWRKKPFGTAHACLSARNFVDGPFVILNSDDLYGEETLMKLVFYLRAEPEKMVIPGYKLDNCVPQEGGVNRGIISEENERVTGIEENLGVLRSDFGEKYSGEELVSMNVFGFNTYVFPYFERKFVEFVEKCGEEEEFLLPSMIGDYVQEEGGEVKVFPTSEVPLGLTNPGDEEVLRKKLREMGEGESLSI